MTAYLYVIGTKTNRQKIGFSADVEKRLSSIQTGNPEQLYIHHKIECATEKTRPLEKKIHAELSYKRIKGEWFDMTPEEATSYLEFARITWLDSYIIYN